MDGVYFDYQIIVSSNILCTIGTSSRQSVQRGAQVQGAKLNWHRLEVLFHQTSVSWRTTSGSWLIEWSSLCAASRCISWYPSLVPSSTVSSTCTTCCKSNVLSLLIIVPWVWFNQIIICVPQTPTRGFYWLLYPRCKKICTCMNICQSKPKNKWNFYYLIHIIEHIKKYTTFKITVFWYNNLHPRLLVHNKTKLIK